MSNKYSEEFRSKVMQDIKREEMSIRGIAKKYGISETTVSNWKNGYNSGNKKPEQYSKSECNQAMAYLAAGHSVEEISVLIGMSKSKIRSLIDERGLYKQPEKKRKKRKKLCWITVSSGAGYWDWKYC